MIKIILDKAGHIKSGLTKDTHIVTETEDYLVARQAIYGAELEEKDITVYVRSPVCCHWFWDLEEHPNAVVTKCDPCSALKEKLGVLELPADLEKHPEAILELDLLAEPAPGSFVDVWSWILERKVGKCWSENMPSLGHLYDLISWFLHNPNIRKDGCGLLKSRQDNQIKVWLEKADGRLQKAYRWFLKDPKHNAFFLLGFQILKAYPQEIKEEWLSELSSNFGSFNHELFAKFPDLPRIFAAIPTVDKHAKIYWQSQLRKKTVDFESEIAQTSGELPGELEAFSGWLESNLKECTQRRIDLLRLQFKVLSSVSETCSRLEDLMAPTYPREPQPNWGWNEWKEWAVKEYLPYRSWLERNESADTRVDEFSMLYSEWLYANYPKYIFAFEPLVYGVFKKVKQRVDKGNTILWLLIDNLSWVWAQELIEIFEKNSIRLAKEPCLRLSMLPSETTVSKSAILGGLPQSLLSNENYREMIHKCWTLEGNYNVRYGANEKSLRRLLSKPAQVYIYQCDRLDVLAHEPEYRIVDRKRAIKDALVWLTDIVREGIESFPNQSNLHIIVCSDHGSTLIREGKKNLRPPKSAIEDEASKKHKRFIKINDVLRVDGVSWYVLSAEKFALKDNYAIARGYSYLRSRPQGYTHGGLTPEETMVPYLEFFFGLAKPVYPIRVVHRSQPILRGREQNLTLVLQNPNPFCVTEVSLRLPRYFVETQVDSIDAESEAETSEFNIILEPKLPVENGYVEIEGVCSYMIYGKRRVFNLRVKLKVREIFKVEGLEDLF